MRIAIVGSREFAPLEAVRTYVAALPQGTVIVTGGWPSNAGGYRVVEATRGVDREAYVQAERAGLVTVLVAGSRTRQEHLAGLQRNPVIVDLADIVVAFWDLRSSGTAATLRHALDAGKQVAVIGPQGPVPHWRQFMPARE